MDKYCAKHIRKKNTFWFFSVSHTAYNLHTLLSAAIEGERESPKKKRKTKPKHTHITQIKTNIFHFERCKSMILPFVRINFETNIFRVRNSDFSHSQIP